MLSRRELIWSTTLASAVSLKAETPHLETITRQPDYYHGWPTLVKRSDGELIAVCSGGRESHVCPFGRVELMRSRDGGHTWSWPEVILDTPIDDRDAGICETAKGTLLVTTFTSLAFQDTFKKASDWPEERRARWNAVIRRGTQEQFDSLLGTWMLRSTDGGMTWSKPIEFL